MNEQLEQQGVDKKDSNTMEQFSARLRDAREEKGLTIESVAAELRLNVDLIRALEYNDTDNLPSKIFVMGYLRSYARLLSVDEGALEQLDLSEIHQSVDVKSTFSRPPEKNSKHLSIRLVTYLITAGMLSLLAVWWLSMQSDVTKMVSVDDVQQQELAMENRLSLPIGNIEQPEQSSNEEVIPEQQPAIADKSDSEVSTPATINADFVAETAIEAEVVESDEEPIAQSQLTITYLEDSWTEISDADDNRLLYGLYKQGKEVVVNGVAPFTLFFGFAPGVVVSHNEEQIDHSAYHRKGVARFKVGAAEDNHLPAAN